MEREGKGREGALSRWRWKGWMRVDDRTSEVRCEWITLPVIVDVNARL